MSKAIKIGLMAASENNLSFNDNMAKLEEKGASLKQYSKMGNLLRAVVSNEVDLAILNGHAESTPQIAAKILAEREMLPVLVLAERAIDPERVVEIMRLKVTDLLLSPTFELLQETVAQHASSYRLWLKIHETPAARKKAFPAELLGTSKEIKSVNEKIERFAAGVNPVLIAGPQGSHLMKVAHYIHDLGGYGMFERVDKILFEAESVILQNPDLELQIGKRGNMTLFCEGAENLSKALQNKICDYFAKNEYKIKKVKFIVASNLSLQRMREEGLVSDRFYALFAGNSVEIPPLKERCEDVPYIAMELLRKITEGEGKYFMDFSPSALDLLARQPWNFNFNELKSVIEKIIWRYDGSLITLEMVKTVLNPNGQKSEFSSSDEYLDKSAGIRKLDEVINAHVEHAVNAFNGDIGRAAKALGVGRATLYRRMAKHGLKKSRKGGQELII